MKNQQRPDNPLVNIAVNILIPVFVLNKGHHFLSGRLTLIVALAFPLIYGIQDYWRRRHKNYVSLIGIVNISITGSLALMQLHGIWFACKEAIFPLLLGALVLASRWTQNPAAKIIFCNPQVMNIDLIEQKLDLFGKRAQFDHLIQQTTLWFSTSFVVSALCNFVIATRVFIEIDSSLPPEAQDKILNGQIAQMTWTSFMVIAGPLTVFSVVLVMRFMRRLSAMTEIPVNDLLKG